MEIHDHLGNYTVAVPERNEGHAHNTRLQEQQDQYHGNKSVITDNGRQRHPCVRLQQGGKIGENIPRRKQRREEVSSEQMEHLM